MGKHICEAKPIMYVLLVSAALFLLSMILSLTGKQIDIYGSGTYDCISFLNPYGIVNQIIPEGASIYKTARVYVQCNYSPWAPMVYNWFVLFMVVTYWLSAGYVYKGFIKNKNIFLRVVFDIVILCAFPLFIFFLFLIGYWFLTAGSGIAANA